MRESNRISILGKILVGAGLGLIGISGFLNINNSDKKGTPEYSVSCRDKTFYSMVVASGVMIAGGTLLLAYPTKRKNIN